MNILKIISAVLIVLSICLIIYDYRQSKLYIGRVIKKQFEILIYLKIIVIIVLIILILVGCKTTETKILLRPFTKPPDRYEIGEITNSQQELLEYTKAVFQIARWQNWFNSQVGSNYYNYYNYSNYILTNTNKNTVLITNTVEIVEFRKTNIITTNGSNID